MPNPVEAYRRHKGDAVRAWRLFSAMCGDHPPPRVPGMDTVIRLAVRIEHGASVEQAAAREYVYRWRLAIGRPDETARPWLVFGAPHLLGQ